MNMRTILALLLFVNISSVICSYIISLFNIEPVLIIVPLVIILLATNNIIILRLHSYQRFIDEWEEEDDGDR